MNIVAWGDSITYGQGDAEGLGWPGLLRKESFSVGGPSIYNRGICGNSSKDVLERFDAEAASLKPETALIALGMNDSKFPNGGNTHKVSIEDFKKNIKELVSRARTYTGKIVLIGITEVKTESIESPSLFTNESVCKFDDLLQEVSVEENVFYISMRGVLNPEADLFDGLHPNAQGYKKMFQTIKDSGYIELT